MIDGLLVEADGGRYVVPMGQVEECVALAADDGRATMGRDAAIVRGELVPIVSLRGVLGVGRCRPGARELLLTRHAEQRVGVAVDRLLGRVQAVIQPLDEGLRRPPAILRRHDPRRRLDLPDPRPGHPDRRVPVRRPLHATLVTPTRRYPPTGPETARSPP